jgi:hypothetical protein
MRKQLQSGWPSLGVDLETTPQQIRSQVAEHI